MAEERAFVTIANSFKNRLRANWMERYICFKILPEELKNKNNPKYDIILIIFVLNNQELMFMLFKLKCMNV